MIDAILWLAPLAIGVVFGRAWGISRAAAPAPLPADWKAGYVAGYDEAREQCLKVARAHDFNTIEMQLTRMQANP